MAKKKNKEVNDVKAEIKKIVKKKNEKFISDKRFKMQL